METKATRNSTPTSFVRVQSYGSRFGPVCRCLSSASYSFHLSLSSHSLRFIRAIRLIHPIRHISHSLHSSYSSDSSHSSNSTNSSNSFHPTYCFICLCFSLFTIGCCLLLSPVHTWRQCGSARKMAAVNLVSIMPQCHHKKNATIIATCGNIDMRRPKSLCGFVVD